MKPGIFHSLREGGPLDPLKSYAGVFIRAAMNCILPPEADKVFTVSSGNREKILLIL
jgi:hypothetical protein